MSDKLQFTICTPTYNRVHTLTRVFESLQNQTFKNFEWVIIDDGSNDGTKSLIDGFLTKSTFNIKYFYKENGGKHRAINFGIKYASGELFIILDSDDMYTKDALETIYNVWNNNKGMHINCSGIIALDQDTNGNIIGDKFPKNLTISNFNDLTFKYHLKGDKLIVSQTAILKKFPFPEFENEKFIAEGSVWHEISKYYNTILINQALLIVEYQEDGLSSDTVRLRRKNPNGALYNYLKQLELDIPFKYKLKAAINAYRFSLNNYNVFFKCITSMNIFYSLLSFPVGVLLYILDIYKIREI